MAGTTLSLQPLAAHIPAAVVGPAGYIAAIRINTKYYDVDTMRLIDNSIHEPDAIHTESANRSIVQNSTPYPESVITSHHNLAKA